MKKTLFFFAIITLLASCDAAKSKTKEVINDGGEIIGEGLGELGKGIDEGIDNALTLNIDLSDTLKYHGIELGKVIIDSWDTNEIDIYVIYNESFMDIARVTLADQNGLEMGRTTVYLNGMKGDAGYVTCVFDERAHIESDSQVSMDLD